MEYKMLTVGSENHRALCRIYNDNDDVETSYHEELEGEAGLKKYSEVAYLHSHSQNHPFSNILVGTEQGQL